MSSDYTSKHIKVLDEISHIRLNAGMYIGETSRPDHLLTECLDNALDECFAGHANIVAVNLNMEKYIYSVIDNGRGIPIENDVAKTISTKLFSGSKFQDSKTAYKIVAGKHGIGITAVNALSTDYTIEIYRNNKYAIYKFKESKYKSKKILDYENKNIPFSTKIQFIPDSKIFESLKVDINKLKQRLLISSVELPNVTFVLNIDNQREIIKIDKFKFFMDQCINSTKKDISKIIDIQAEEKIEKLNFLLSYDYNCSTAPKIISSVNILPVEGGGTHINMLYEILRDIFTSKAKKLGVRILPQDCLCGLRSYLSLSLIKPEFSGQNKSKLINRKSYLEPLYKKLKLQLNEWLDNNPEELNNLIEFFAEYRRKLDSKNIKSTNNGKRASTKFTKLRDCKSRDGELFVTEGDSAGGGFIACRNPIMHAVLPLKGKIPSAANAKDILKNKEIGELIQSLGTGVGSNFNIDNLRYSRILCACDADADGGHIASLLTLALALLVPDIIKQGKYYIVETPLYAINEKKVFIPLWDEESLKQAKLNDKSIIRLKGLGELNPDQLKQVAVEPKTRKITKVEFSKNIEKITKLFIGADEKRKLLSGKWNI